MAATGEILSFGPFDLIASERLLTKDGVPVEMGGRALDILITLSERPNEVVSKRELLDRVWPDVTVEEGSLRFHLASLRKALGEGKDGARYIVTLAGRGYCFVAPVSRSRRDAIEANAVSQSQELALPNRLLRMIGREEDVLKLSARLTSTRFVTIVGAGGVGKTTVAVAVGHHLVDAFAGAVSFVDLGMLADPRLVATAVASMLGLSVQSEDPTPGLVAYLRGKRLLLILDTCEHLIDAVSALAANIRAAAADVHILATSREALQVEGEHVYKLDALASPPENTTPTVADLERFPATGLFLERALATGARLDLDDAHAAIIVGICRRLDGVALAIELAARRVESHGLQQTAELLDQRLTLFWVGPRSAPPRQKTLQATLDWSYGLLSQLERTVLRRLAVFAGHFTLDAALEVVTDAAIDQPLVFAAIDSLVGKFMVAARPVGAMMRYRLLDTTRAYVLETSIGDTELADLMARHAAYYRRWLEQFGTDWLRLSTGAERASHFAAVNNVRAALEWSFGGKGDIEVGIGLAVAAAPVLLAMSLLTECHDWCRRAILALDDGDRGGLDDMHLQAALGVSLMFMQGGRAAAHNALARSLAIAEQRGEAVDQLRLLCALNMFHRRTREFGVALDHARRCSEIAQTVDDPGAIPLANVILGVSLHLSGDLVEARRELEAALGHEPRLQPTTTVYLGFEGKILAGAILARTLWLQGYPARAATRARDTVDTAAGMGHPLSLAIALIWGTSVSCWTGDLQTAEHYTDQLVSAAESYSMSPFLAVGNALRGALAVQRGDPKHGVEALQRSLQQLHAAPYELLTTELTLALCRGLFALGRFDEVDALIDETRQQVVSNGDLLFMPELLRIKGCILVAATQPRLDEAEDYFLQSLGLSRELGARGWELRTAVDLAMLWTERRQRRRARELLAPVFASFSEGLDTVDLQVAGRLLASLA